MPRFPSVHTVPPIDATSTCWSWWPFSHVVMVVPTICASKTSPSWTAPGPPLPCEDTHV
jgi:hypothetical protein